MQLKGQKKQVEMHFQTQIKDLEGQIVALRRSSEQKDNEYAKSRNEKEEAVRSHHTSCLWSF
jgi:hypothetical protein